MKKIFVSVFLFFILFQSKNIFALELNKNTDQIYASGDTIGLDINLGLAVVGTFGVKEGNKIQQPWKIADIKEGDSIIRFAGEEVLTQTDLQKLIAVAKNNETNITIQRDGEILEKRIKAAKKTDGTYSLGLYIRDKVLGIGTLTYVIPGENIYGSLGHSVKSPEIKGGSLKEAIVTEIKKADFGRVGEKNAEIKKTILGTIEKNTETGVHGKINNESYTFNSLRPLLVETRDRVKPGKATILTCIDGKNVEEFKIEIVEAYTQARKDVKGMKIKVTDERLIEKTGGIIQGMSGSPIIQNGRLVGAVTHVLINNPLEGYAIYIEWMLEDMGVYVK